MGGDKDCNPPFGSLINKLPELATGSRIYSTRRLIQKDDLRLVKDGNGESKFLFPAQRQTFYQRITFGTQPDAFQKFIGLAGYFIFCHTVNPGKQPDILPHFQVFVKRKLLAHIADILFHIFRPGGNIETGYAGRTSCGTAQSGKHAHGSSLSGTVGTQEAEYLATMNFERDMIHCREIAETLGELIHFDDILIFLFHLAMLQSRRTKNACELIQNTFRSIYPMYLPLIDKSDAVTLACLINNRRRGYDGDTLFLQPAKHPPKLLAGNRVYPCCRLVEQKHIRFMNKRTTQRQFLLHTSGQSSGTAFAERLYLLVDILHQFIILLNGGMENSSEEVQVLFYRQVLIEGEASRHIAYATTDFFIIFRYIQTTHRSISTIGKQQGGEDTEKRSLPRPVRPDNTEQLSGRNRQGNTLQRLHCPILLSNVIYNNRMFHKLNTKH